MDTRFSIVVERRNVSACHIIPIKMLFFVTGPAKKLKVFGTTIASVSIYVVNLKFFFGWHRGITSIANHALQEKKHLFPLNIFGLNARQFPQLIKGSISKLKLVLKSLVACVYKVFYCVEF